MDLFSLILNIHMIITVILWVTLTLLTLVLADKDPVKVSKVVSLLFVAFLWPALILFYVFFTLVMAMSFLSFKHTKNSALRFLRISWKNS